MMIRQALYFSPLTKITWIIPSPYVNDNNPESSSAGYQLGSSVIEPSEIQHGWRLVSCGQGYTRNEFGQYRCTASLNITNPNKSHVGMTASVNGDSITFPTVNAFSFSSLGTDGFNGHTEYPFLICGFNRVQCPLPIPDQLSQLP